MADISVLTASGDFELPEPMRRFCALTLEDGSLFEYVSETFNGATHDSNNRFLHARIACIKKYGNAVRRKIPESGIRRIYEHHEKTGAVDGNKQLSRVETDNLPLEQSTRIFLDVIRRAVEEKASDVHWVVRENSVTVLFRVFGRIECMGEFSFGRDFATGLLGAIYGSSKDVTDRSFSPRNRSSCSLHYDDPAVSIRWQTVPTGDSQGFDYDVVLRATRQDQSMQERILTLEELGYLPDQSRLLAASCNSPGGIIMSGITGSGKTTALRSLMQMARGNGDKKIYTVEDPIELKIFGATQVSARGHNMAEIMQSFLRADPDIIMVGEIRNREVANVMQTVLRSGHKMMTTIHAPSALGIVPRLASDEIGIHHETLMEPGFIAALAYQYLLPTLCQHCKLPAAEHRDKIGHLAFHLFEVHRYALDESGLFIRNEKGCSKCRKGISGMTICAEVIRPTYEIVKMLREKRDAEALHAYRLLRRAPFDSPVSEGKTSYEIAIYKASQGLIDPRDINDMCGEMMLQEVVKGHYESGGI